MKYYKLFDILTRRGIKRKEFAVIADISSTTLAKMSKAAEDTTINIKTIEKICKALNVQPGDIMEYEQ